MYPCRVFVSYSHPDRLLVERLVKVLDQAGVAPMWDNDLVPGTGFSEQIQRFITNSHVLLPVLTPASAERPWVHQEIGFALALGKAVLPVSTGGAPLGIISTIQTMQLREDLADAPAKLSAECFRRLMDGLQDRPATYECTDDNAQRAQLLARYAENVAAISQYGQVRQMASLTSFQLPDRGAADPVWKKYFPANPRDHHLFGALRRERVALQKHARERGCRLILDPVERLEDIYHEHGLSSVQARVRGLLAFLRDGSLPNVVIAINDDAERTTSITLVGDWFSSEAVSSGGRARVSGKALLREALFTRDVSVVRQQIEDFDNRLLDLLTDRGWDEESSRAKVEAYLQAYLDRSSDRQS
jgi:hypothetical protein